MRAYRIAFGGKRINKGFVAFRALSPMASGKKRQQVECKISLHLVDPDVDLQTFDADNNPLSDEQLREMDNRQRFPIFTNKLVSGSELSAMVDPVALPMDILTRLRTGQVEIDFLIFY